MKKNNYNVIGVMSGTSLDGVDLAQIQFHIKNNKWCFEIIENETIEYSQEWLNKLKLAINFSNPELSKLDQEYTQLLATLISSFINKHQIENLDAVCSHGHTILHQPKNGLTLQIGNLPEMAGLINQKVVCNFRIQDVELGGQGAPLVPMGDRLLFSDYDFCINLGGFSNISFEQNNKRIAFDISPVNTVLNYYANQLGMKYDDKGEISKTGKINIGLLEYLNALTYYKQSFPKSLGFEFVKNTVIPSIEKFELDIKDKLCTFVEHVAFQTALSLNNFETTHKKILITGGGAYNDFLIYRIKVHLPKAKIHIPTSKIVEYKEALIFALLGVLKLRNETNVLSSVTGAKIDHCAGFEY